MNALPGRRLAPYLLPVLLGCPGTGRGMPSAAPAPSLVDSTGGGSPHEPPPGTSPAIPSAGAAPPANLPETQIPSAPHPDAPQSTVPEPPGGLPAASTQPGDAAAPLPLVLFVPEGGSHGRVGEMVQSAWLDVRRSGPKALVTWQPLSAPPHLVGLPDWLLGRVPSNGLLVLAPLPSELRTPLLREAAARNVSVVELLPRSATDQGTAGASLALLPSWALEAPVLMRHAASRGARTLGILLPKSQKAREAELRAAAEAAGLSVPLVALYPTGETAFAEQARSLAAAHPEAVLLIGRASEVRLMIPALQLAGASRRPGALPWAPIWLLPSGAYGPTALAANLRPLLGAWVAHPLPASQIEELERRHLAREGRLPRSAFFYHAAAALLCLQEAARSIPPTPERALRVAQACRPRPERVHVLRLCAHEGRPALCPPEAEDAPSAT